MQVEIRRRLRLGHVLGGHDDGEGLGEPRRLEHGGDEGAGRVRGDADRPPAVERRDELERPRQRLDALLDLDGDEVVELASERLALSRPVEEPLEDPAARLERGAEERRLLLAAEGAAVAPEEGRLGARPAALGVEQEAVAVEDDRAAGRLAPAQEAGFRRWKNAE